MTLEGYHRVTPPRDSISGPRALWQTALVSELEQAERDRDEPASSDEPPWRARARAWAIASLGLGLVVDLAHETSRPTEVLGSIAVVLAVSLRTPFGVAALAIDVVLELLDAVGAHTRGSPLLSAGHASSALGLAALALVLYRRSDDEVFERRATLSGLAAMVLGVGAFVASLARSP